MLALPSRPCPPPVLPRGPRGRGHAAGLTVLCAVARRDQAKTRFVAWMARNGIEVSPKVDIRALPLLPFSAFSL